MNEIDVVKLTFLRLATPVMLFFCLLLAGCNADSAPHRYLFLGHPYDWGSENRVDPRLETFDYSPYDQIWLGGDVCARTAKQPETMDYLDSVFRLDRVHWALGNHDWDYGNRENVLNRLPDPPFYTVWQDGFCLTVLNTNLFWPYPSLPPQEYCTEKAAQLEMIRQVADTISQASHWLILHHHALFSDKMVSPQQDTIRSFNVNPIPYYSTCDSVSEVSSTLYPELARAQNRGVDVICIGGDLGMRAKQFEFKTPEGIWLLGSGINNSVSREYAPEYVKDFGRDYMLEVWYQEGKMEWAFVPLGGDWE